MGASTIAERWVGPAIVATGGRIAGIVSRSAERAEQLARPWGARAYPSVEALLDDARVDAVYVSTTNERHAAAARACLERSVPVLVEKPIATTVAEAEGLVALAAERDVPLAVNHHLRNVGVHRRVRELVAAGAIGEPRAAQVHHVGVLGEEWRGWRLRDAAAGAGVALDLLTHSVDLLRFVLDQEVVAARSVAAPPTLADAGIDDHRMTVLRFERGTLGFSHDAYTVAERATALRIVGDRGSLTVTDAMRQSRAMTLTVDDGDGERTVDVPEQGNAYEIGVAEFATAIRDGALPAAGGVDGLRALAVALAAASDQAVAA